MAAVPRPRTVQSTVSRWTGSTWRTGPKGASGDSRTATPAANSEPAAMAPPRPDRPSTVVSTGSAPMERRTSRSVVCSRTWRPMDWEAMTSTAMPAMRPNTPRASDSGFTDCSACSSMTEVMWM